MKFKSSAIQKQEEELKKSNDLNRLLWLDPSVIHEDPENSEVYDDNNKSRKEEYLDLKADIAENGIKQPILIKTHPNLPMEYMVISGHRRLKVAKELNIKIPVMVENIEDEVDFLKSKLALIKTNQLTRNRTPQEKLKEVEFLERYYKKIRKLDPEIKGSTRSLIAESTGLKERQVADYQKLKNNLRPGDREAFDKGEINMKEALDKIDNYQNIDIDSICEIFIGENKEKEENRFTALDKEKIYKEIVTTLSKDPIFTSDSGRYEVSRLPTSDKKVVIKDNKEEFVQEVNIRNIANNIYKYNQRYFNIETKEDHSLLFTDFLNNISTINEVKEENKEILKEIKVIIEGLI